MSGTITPEQSSHKDERTISEMIYDNEVRGIPDTYENGRDLAL